MSHSRTLRIFSRYISKNSTINLRQADQASILKEAPHKNFEKLKEKQSFFQQRNGLPTYLKAGIKDKMLFQVTLLFLGIGLVMSLETAVRLTLPRA